jgi:signal recognition particle receptor subunit beta
MAAFDKDRLIVRVAYAGAPMAGKTESVRALLPMLKGQGAERQVMSPAEDRGRTAYFDWADYEGGAFQGKPIHCQITSVPGQVALSSRRELLLRGADAVILVVDSRSEAIERAQQCYEEMAPWLMDAGREVPIRLLLQCNKQDLPGSLTPDEIRRALGLDFGKDVYATSARTGKGLRATFVAGVRVAVERAKAQIARGLILKTAEITSGDELYEVMQRDEAFQNLRRREPVARKAAASDAGARSGRARAPAKSPTSDAPTSSTEAVLSSRAVSSNAVPSNTAHSSEGRGVTAGRGPARAAHESSTHLRAAAAPEPVRAPSSPPPSGESAPTKATPTHAPGRAKGGAARSRAAQGAQRDGAALAPEPAARVERAKRITWSPESGPRPAVLPASVYEAAMARLGRASAKPEPRTTAAGATEQRRGESLSTAARKPQPAAAARSAAAHTGGARPAVMPASAYLASIGKSAATASAAARSSSSARATGVEVAALVSEPKPAASRTPPAKKPGARPAVAPSEAWLAQHAAAQSTSGSAAPSTTAARSIADDTPPTSPSRVSGAPLHVVPRVGAPRTQRPAVMPSQAWLAQREAARALEALRPSAPPSRRAATSSIRPAPMPPSAWEEEPGAWVTPEPAPRRASPRSTRPAVMPASAWRASVANEFRSASPANEVERAALEASHVERARLEASELERAALERPTQVPPPGASVEPTSGSDELASGPLSSLFPLSLVPTPSTRPLPASAGSRTPPLPGRGLSPRAVWPRNVWRILEPQITPRGRALKDARDRWLGELAPGWYARTLETAPDAKSARRTFAGAVLRQRKLKQHLSSPRCLALTEDAEHWLIWQVVYRVPTLATTLGKALAAGEPPGVIADALVQCAEGYLDAHERFITLPEPLPLSLHALSAHEGRFVYAGLLPNAGATLSKPSGDAMAALEEALRKRWSEAAPQVDVQALIVELHASARDRLPAAIVDVIGNVVRGATVERQNE